MFDSDFERATLQDPFVPLRLNFWMGFRGKTIPGYLLDTPFSPLLRPKNEYSARSCMLLGRCWNIESAKEIIVGAMLHADHLSLKRLFRKSWNISVRLWLPTTGRVLGIVLMIEAWVVLRIGT